jgi:hypothetical protein
VVGRALKRDLASVYVWKIDVWKIDVWKIDVWKIMSGSKIGWKGA